MTDLSDLHAFYDGPIPKAARAVAKAGGIERYRYLRALATRRAARDHVAGSITLIREYRRNVGEGRRRPDDAHYRAVLSGLHAMWRWYRQAAKTAAEAVRVYNAAGRPGETPPGVAMMRDLGQYLMGTKQ
jgi:hypothetical protein